MISPVYRKQVDLLLLILPHIGKEKMFVLKGGTAINLFVRDMPRLSVDIDLTYAFFDERDTALKSISDGLGRIKASLEKAISGMTATIGSPAGGSDAKLICQIPGTAVKIEVNTIMRGHIFPPVPMLVSEAVQNEFGKFAGISVVSHAELFGGKVCAALDRQHPRDLFDVYHLLENESFTDEIRLGFIASLLSHNRPINEIIRPNFLDQRQVFKTQFSGMVFSPFSYDDYEATRIRLVREIHENLTEEDREFLISFKAGAPKWSLFPLNVLQRLPAVKWKLQNIQKLKKQNPEKHLQQLNRLIEKLSS